MTGSAAEVGRWASALLRAVPGAAEWTPGLSPSEFDDLQQRFDIEFADEHRAFLAARRPVRQRLAGLAFPLDGSATAPDARLARRAGGRGALRRVPRSVLAPRLGGAS